MKAFKKALATVFAAAAMIAVLAAPSAVKADEVTIPYDANGIFLGTSHTDYSKAITFEKKGISIDHTKEETKYVNKLRMSMEDMHTTNDEKTEDTKFKVYSRSYGLNVYTKDSTTELVSVKTNSKNLKAIVNYHYKWQYGTQPTTYDGSIALLAKKAGKYKVTATFKLASGATATSTAQVLVTKTSPIYWNLPKEGAQMKNVAYAGVTFSSDKVKVGVKKGAGISGIKLFYTDNNSTGSYTNTYGYDANDNYFDTYTSATKKTYTKIKNGGIVKLGKKTSYTAVQANEYNYSNYRNGYSYKETSKSTTTYNNFYPYVTVYCFYKDGYYGIQTYETLNIYKNKKM